MNRQSGHQQHLQARKSARRPVYRAAVGKGINLTTAASLSGGLLVLVLLLIARSGSGAF